MKERFGKFLLLEEIGLSSLGKEYRAAKLAPGGAPERLVSLTRLSPELSQNAAFAQALMAQAKAASLLLSPSLLKLVAIGRAENSYYLAYEHYDGKSLKTIFERTRRERFPLAPDHALVILSKVCAALEYAHGKQGEFGPNIHGLLSPGAVVVTHDGDVKLRGFGLWAAGIREAAGVTPEEWGYLSPEQVGGGVADARSDVFAAGAILFEALTGQPLRAPQQEGSSKARIETARLAAAHEAGPLPRVLAEIVSCATADDAFARFPDMAELRRSIDAQLFSGDFNPTTFNLAFFMHSLFREEIEKETKASAQHDAKSYAEPNPASAPGPPASVAQALPPVPPLAAAAEAAVVEEQHAPDLSGVKAGLVREELPVPRVREPASLPRLPLIPVTGPAATRGGARAAGARKWPLVAAIVGAIGVLGTAAVWYFLAGPGALRAAPAPPPSSVSSEAAQAMARVKELETKLKQFEREKLEAEALAAKEAKSKLEAQAAARGQRVDPAALQKAQEDARRAAQAEQEKRQQEERRRLEQEQRAAEARLVEERRRAEAAPASPPATTLPAGPPPVTTSPTLATAPPATLAALPSAAAPAPPEPQPQPNVPAPAIKPGTLVNLTDLGVVEPVAERQPTPVYPAIARQRRVEGTVELSVLVDEKGDVADVKLLKGAPGIGLNEAAIESVKRRKYRPATKDGVPVKVYVPVLVKFTLTQ